VHVPLVARNGTPQHKDVAIRLEQLVDAGEAMLLEMVKLTRQACRKSVHVKGPY
jgi:pyroglutamyl-peptidase